MTALQTPRSPGYRPGDASAVHVLHSGHYHASLLRALYEAQGIDARTLIGAAFDLCGDSASPGEPRSASETQAWIHRAGLGTLSPGAETPDGLMSAMLEESHFATAWRRRFPVASEPVCGVTAALLERLLRRGPGAAVRVEETRCAAVGAHQCVFTIQVGDRPVPASRVAGTPPASAAPGRLGEGVQPRALRSGTEHRAQLNTATAETIEPGGPYASLPAGFYVALARLFEEEVPRTRGAKYASLPAILLLEAAHRSAFHLFGAILAADRRSGGGRGAGEDAERVCLEPLFATVGRLGWGRWEVRDFVPGERLIARMEGSYEGVAHASLFGSSERPRCTVARGAAATIMNLLYREAGPANVPLSSSHYHALFRSPRTFRALETRCVAQGDTCCELVVNPLTA